MTAFTHNPVHPHQSRSGGIRFVALAAMMVALSACASKSRDVNDPRYLLSGQHRIVVTQGEKSLPVMFGQGESTLAPHALAPVQAFADNFVDQGGGELFIEIADSGDADADMAGMLSYLGAEIRKRGVRAEELIVRPAQSPRSTRVTLVYAKYSASVPGCPDWSSDFGDFHRNTAHSNFGCAYRGNFAKMVANPKDLVEPREMSNAEANQTSRAISKYRSGEVEPVAATSSEIGESE